MGGGILRGVLVGSVVTIVSLFFTRLALTHVFAVISAVLLTSMVFALGGFINALFAKNFDQISWFPTFVLTPLTYLGGVFYSITMLPGWAHIVSHANPILYMVSAFRYGFLGTTDVDLRLAYGIMVSCGCGNVRVAVALLNRGTGIATRQRETMPAATITSASSGSVPGGVRNDVRCASRTAGGRGRDSGLLRRRRGGRIAARAAFRRRFVGGGFAVVAGADVLRTNHVGSVHNKANADSN